MHANNAWLVCGSHTQDPRNKVSVCQLHQSQVLLLESDISFNITTVVCLRSQNGSSPDIFPLDWQTLADGPVSE